MLTYAVAVIGPWGLFYFLALAVAVLWATERWMAALGFWSDGGEKGIARPLRAFLAVSSTSAAVGVWYALAFWVLPSGA